MTILHIRAPGLRFPIWLPLLSICLWALTVLTGIVVMCLPKRTLQRFVKETVPVSPIRLGWQLIRLAHILLWSGSFTLCDVQVPNEGVRVRIRTI